MPDCQGCSRAFLYLDTDNCQACQKKANLPKDSWGEVDSQGQCSGCGVIWRFLKDPLCAPCKKHQSNITTNPTAHVDPGINLLAQNIHHSAAFFERQASQSRLHQKVHSVATKSQASQNILARTAAMRKQNKGDDIMFQVVLFYWPLNLGVAKKLQANKFAMTFSSGHLATDVLKDLFRKAELAYLDIPEDRRPLLSFLTDDSSVEVSLVQGSDNQKIDDSYLLGTVGELFNQLQKSGTLSPTTENKRKLILRFTAWEKKPAIDEEANFSDADVIAVSKRRSNSAPATSPPKRKVRKIKVAIGVHSEQSGASQVSTVSPAEKLEYETFQFTCFDYELDETGRMCEIVGDELEDIEIADGWLKHAKEGLPVGGYISKGLSKYAFKGHLGGKEYAIFQGIPSWTFDTQNSTDLHDELKLLRRGEYFLEDFKKRIRHASEYQTSLIPCIEWHSESDTFIGQLVPPLKNLGCAAADQLQNMLFNTFLAAPLLDIRAKGNEEVRFVGNTDIENNKYALPAVINAFIHSALVDSAGQYLFADLQGLVYPGNFPDQTVILFDPQAHTPSFSSGHWDLGPSQIYKFVKQHICNKFCRMADLDDIRTFDQSLIAAPSAENGNEVEVEAQNGKSVHSIPRRSHPLREGWE
ncbi:hypothetical protein CPB84DRAFT_1846000 [Gymnopilus junonius]|uniref:Alpha-type protein kinase domain-containing protein n=1 Tax=Gymnopilus junonius TaxID=109634 RepID=A0A9P5NNN4_GYMJU|nr:hypothetical protein CPB84DRAFT_1846000 [Gymnopilus junonius]